MGNYVTESDIRAEGVPASTPNAIIERRIAKWEKIVENLTGQIFYEVTPGELLFEGNNSRILHFNLPITELISIKLNGESAVLDPSEYRVFLNRTPPRDDRRNPRIELTPLRSNIYRTSPGLFVKGLDQLITAKWGYLEPDDTTPQPIKDAIIELVILDLDNYFEKVEGAGSTLRLPVKRERTDGHELEYSDPDSFRIKWGMIPTEIAEVIMMYKAPMTIASPEPERYTFDPSVQVIGY